MLSGLNLIRVWGGGLTERPEFYDACDELGVLVMQEVRWHSYYLMHLVVSLLALLVLLVLVLLLLRVQ